MSFGKLNINEHGPNAGTLQVGEWDAVLKYGDFTENDWDVLILDVSISQSLFFRVSDFSTGNIGDFNFGPDIFVSFFSTLSALCINESTEKGIFIASQITEIGSVFSSVVYKIDYCGCLDWCVEVANGQIDFVNNFVEDIISDGSDYIYVLLNTSSDLYVIKILIEDGTIEWTTKVTDGSVGFQHFAIKNANSVWIHGRELTPVGGGSNINLIEIDSDGNILQEILEGGTFSGTRARVGDVCFDSSGNRFSFVGTLDTSTLSRVYKNNVLWLTVSGNRASSYTQKEMTIDTGDNVIITFPGTDLSQHTTVRKYNSSASLVWERLIFMESPVASTSDEDDSIYIVGATDGAGNDAILKKYLSDGTSAFEEEAPTGDYRNIATKNRTTNRWGI